MHLVKRVHNIHQILCRCLLKSLWAIQEFIEIIKVTSSFILIGKMREDLDVALGSEDSVFFDKVLFKIDPQILVLDTKPVHELGCFGIVLFFLEEDHVAAKLSYK